MTGGASLSVNKELPCVTGNADLVGGAYGDVDPAQIYGVTGTRLAPNPTDGCLIIVRKGAATNTPGSALLFLDRFGVPLAVGDLSHQMLPQWPVADASETALAYTLAARAPLP